MRAVVYKVVKPLDEKLAAKTEVIITDDKQRIEIDSYHIRGCQSYHSVAAEELGNEEEACDCSTRVVLIKTSQNEEKALELAEKYFSGTIERKKSIWNNEIIYGVEND